MRFRAVSFARISAFVCFSPPSWRSFVCIQMILARLLPVIINCAQYFLPSEYLSYAVDDRKDKAKLTTKPVMVSRTESNTSSCQNLDIQVKRVAQQATK